ncbi:TPA: adhesin biosynthesis transcription regulatory family protein [Escherichia coli]|nr:adhesin biosynthesis transcription regulatory family protein [Escherichia coli]
MEDDCIIISSGRVQRLLPGKVDGIQFLLLVEISSIHSEKVIQALGDYLVYGYSRKEACDRHSVSLSYFSITLKRLRKINQAVYLLAPFYINEKSGFASAVNG